MGQPTKKNSFLRLADVCTGLIRARGGDRRSHGGVGLSQGTYDNLFFIHIVRKTNRFGINHTCEMFCNNNHSQKVQIPIPDLVFEGYVVKMEGESGQRCVQVYVQT